MAGWTEHTAEWNTPARPLRNVASRKVTVISFAVSLLAHGALITVVIHMGLWRTPPRFTVQGGDAGVTCGIDSGDAEHLSEPPPATLPKVVAAAVPAFIPAAPQPDWGDAELIPAAPPMTADALFQSSDTVIGVSSAQAVDWSVRFPVRLPAEVQQRVDSAGLGDGASSSGNGQAASSTPAHGTLGAPGSDDGAFAGSPTPASTNRPPRYPAEAKRNRWEGTVTLAVEVSENGSVADVNVEESSGYPLLDQAALDAVRRWTFTPATEAGRPTRSRGRVPIQFSLRG
jgi:protein TonB